MKKKTIIGLIIGILLISIVGATTTLLSSKQEAIDYFNTMKAEEKEIITKLSEDITITTDKICQIGIDENDIQCTICFEYLGIEDCRSFQEGTTETQDKQEILDDVTAMYQELNPVETVTFIEYSIEGDIIKT